MLPLLMCLLLATGPTSGFRRHVSEPQGVLSARCDASADGQPRLSYLRLDGELVLERYVDGLTYRETCRGNFTSDVLTLTSLADERLLVIRTVTSSWLAFHIIDTRNCSGWNVSTLRADLTAGVYIETYNGSVFDVIYALDEQLFKASYDSDGVPTSNVSLLEGASVYQCLPRFGPVRQENPSEGFFMLMRSEDNSPARLKRLDPSGEVSNWRPVPNDAVRGITAGGQGLFGTCWRVSDRLIHCQVYDNALELRADVETNLGHNLEAMLNLPPGEGLVLLLRDDLGKYYFAKVAMDGRRSGLVELEGVYCQPAAMYLHGQEVCYAGLCWDGPGKAGDLTLDVRCLNMQYLEVD